MASDILIVDDEADIRIGIFQRLQPGSERQFRAHQRRLGGAAGGAER